MLLPKAIERKINMIDMDEVSSSLSFFKKMRSVLSKDEMMIALDVSEATYYKFVKRTNDLTIQFFDQANKSKAYWRLWELYTNARWDHFHPKEDDPE